MDGAPTFTPFVHGISDAKTNIQRVHSWLLSLPQADVLGSASDLSKKSVLLEQENYVHQIYQVLTQLEMLPVPGSEAWLAKYQPTIEPVLPVASHLARAVA